ncbi:hypothetical protein CPB86DRAFT_818066 [Serendipita vermifera]|nr:hypothetical protein CPB86DRAFT_818066 [Serendipita vermifera]
MNWDEPHPRRLPTPEEIIRIKDEVALLNSEIASLYTYLHELERDRDNKASFIAPIRRLPPEILGEIAMACLQVGVPPFTLGQVSSSMRNTVNSMKKLWSSIHYFVPRGHNVPDIGQAVTPGYVPVYTLDYLDLVLERSNLMPLRITLQSWNYDALNTIGPFFNMVKKMKIIDDGRYFYERETSFWPSGVYDLTGIQDIEFYGRGTFASATNRFLTEFSRELSNDVRISLDFPDKALMTLLFLTCPKLSFSLY